MAKLSQIDKVYKSYKKKNINLTILHCISSYPNKNGIILFKKYRIFKKRYSCEIGISDHTNDIKIPIYANLMGAKVIEKHLKLNSNHKVLRRTSFNYW